MKSDLIVAQENFKKTWTFATWHGNINPFFYSESQKVQNIILKKESGYKPLT